MTLWSVAEDHFLPQAMTSRAPPAKAAARPAERGGCQPHLTSHIFAPHRHIASRRPCASIPLLARISSEPPQLARKRAVSYIFLDTPPWFWRLRLVKPTSTLRDSKTPQ